MTTYLFLDEEFTLAGTIVKTGGFPFYNESKTNITIEFPLFMTGLE